MVGATSKTRTVEKAVARLLGPKPSQEKLRTHSVSIARMYLEVGDYDNALKYLGYCDNRPVGPARSIVCKLYADIYTGLGRDEEAATMLARARSELGTTGNTATFASPFRSAHSTRTGHSMTGTGTSDKVSLQLRTVLARMEASLADGRYSSAFDSVRQHRLEFVGDEANAWWHQVGELWGALRTEETPGTPGQGRSSSPGAQVAEYQLLVQLLGKDAQVHNALGGQSSLQSLAQKHLASFDNTVSQAPQLLRSRGIVTSHIWRAFLEEMSHRVTMYTHMLSFGDWSSKSAPPGSEQVIQQLLDLSRKQARVESSRARPVPSMQPHTPIRSNGESGALHSSLLIHLSCQRVVDIASFLVLRFVASESTESILAGVALADVVDTLSEQQTQLSHTLPFALQNHIRTAAWHMITHTLTRQDTLLSCDLRQTIFPSGIDSTAIQARPGTITSADIEAFIVTKALSLFQRPATLQSLLSLGTQNVSCSQQELGFWYAACAAGHAGKREVVLPPVSDITDSVRQIRQASLSSMPADRNGELAYDLAQYFADAAGASDNAVSAHQNDTYSQQFYTLCVRRASAYLAALGNSSADSEQRAAVVDRIHACHMALGSLEASRNRFEAALGHFTKAGTFEAIYNCAQISLHIVSASQRSSSLDQEALSAWSKLASKYLYEAHNLAVEARQKTMVALLPQEYAVTDIDIPTPHADALVRGPPTSDLSTLGDKNVAAPQPRQDSKALFVPDTPPDGPSPVKEVLDHPIQGAAAPVTTSSSSSSSASAGQLGADAAVTQQAGLSGNKEGKQEGDSITPTTKGAVQALADKRAARQARLASLRGKVLKFDAAKPATHVSTDGETDERVSDSE